MPEHEVLQTEKFKRNLEDAAFWLYLHNLKQSESFADQNFKELELEINSLKTHLSFYILEFRSERHSSVWKLKL